MSPIAISNKRNINFVITVSAIALVTLAVSGVLYTLFTPQEVYAPSGRRGFMCEYRPTMMTNPWMPYTQGTIQQVSLAQTAREAAMATG